MTILNKLKNLIKVTDFFYSTEMLRYENDLQFKTLTGGIVSLAIIITIIVGFASLILDTLDLNTFIISTQTVKNKVPTSSLIEISDASPFRFAVQIWQQNITQSKRYFDITFRLDLQQNGVLNSSTYFPLEPCTKNFFKGYPQITNHYEQLGAGGWLCPTLNTTLNLQGKYSSENYYQYIIQVSACKNDTDPSRPCASPGEIQDYFLSNKNFFYFSFYYTNTQINPDKKSYKQYYIQDQSYAIFGSDVGSQTFLYLTDYTVQTDYSIWPFSKIQQDSGCYAQDLGINHPFQTNINGTYITWNIAKATNSIIYTRSVQKLSMVLSFMGGMISAVSAVLFIIKIYNNVAFEFAIAFSIFKPKQETNQQSQATSNSSNYNDVIQKSKKDVSMKRKSKQEISMNFFTFIKFHTYKLLGTIGYHYDDPEMKYAKECKDQILSQLDIKKLLKRIIFIEHCLTKILDDYHLDVLQLKKPETPAEIRQIRLKCESIVDQQLQEESNMDAEKSTLNELRQLEKLQTNLAQTPTALKRSQSKETTAQRQDARNARSFFRQRQKAFDVKNEVMILDMEQIKQEKSQHLEDTLKNLYHTKNNKVANHFNKDKKRQSNLVQLLSTAEEGNAISNTIWKKLDKETKKKAARCSKLEYNNL